MFMLSLTLASMSVFQGPGLGVSTSVRFGWVARVRARPTEDSGLLLQTSSGEIEVEFPPAPSLRSLGLTSLNELESGSPLLVYGVRRSEEMYLSSRIDRVRALVAGAFSPARELFPPSDPEVRAKQPRWLHGVYRAPEGKPHLGKEPLQVGPEDPVLLARALEKDQIAVGDSVYVEVRVDRETRKITLERLVRWAPDASRWIRSKKIAPLLFRLGRILSPREIEAERRKRRERRKQGD